MQTLASFDEEEAMMQRQIAHYAEHGPARLHKLFTRLYARSRAQMQMRRQLLQDWLTRLDP